jgi:hypothetical protein
MSTRCPTRLKGEGREFWKRHFDRAVADGRADADLDYDSFVNLCELVYILSEIDPLAEGKQAISRNAANKLYLAYAKQFGLLPKDRKQSGVNEPSSIADALKKFTE